MAPAEARLGNLVKLIYVHGALVWVGLLTFALAGGLALVALMTRRVAWYDASRAASDTALVVWSLYTLSAMAVTALAWGQVIAWNEPRVRASALILLGAAVLWLVVRLVDHPVFGVVVNLVMGIVPWVVVRQAEVIRHPVDPIGGSESVRIQLFYALIVLTVAAMAATLVAFLWTKYRVRRAHEEIESVSD